jgi:hypothetical protein
MEWIPGKRRKREHPRNMWMEGVRKEIKKKTFRNRSVIKQKGMVFGFWKTATAVTWMDGRTDRQTDR